MNGCELPVVICSGSGNQGMTTSLPVIEYAKELKVSKEKLYRALLISNLVTLHCKNGIGRLSAYCGAVSAGAKSSCAAKIATAVETGIFGYEMYMSGQQFYAGEGVRSTDLEIIAMMTEVTETGQEGNRNRK